MFALTSLPVDSWQYSRESNRDTLSLAAFNIQVFGPAKMNNPSAVKVLVKVVVAFPFVLEDRGDAVIDIGQIL